MAKVVDITEKLNYEENPKIKVKDKEIEVNTDAATMLRVMGILSQNDETGPKEIIAMYELIFPEKERKKIEQLKLNFSDFVTLVYTAIGLITGEDDQGEQ